ncbi:MULTISPECIES: 3,4-dihydroxy-2-butanone-4-phosphate synthase [Halococcus]|uniref:3,4-dihydroxy-2-butanone-4-phosphate synthase n=1 Tax=Halococcus sp. PRR34 TaxID=3020830 RepID=UPI000A2F18B5|nr:MULTISPECIES: 3,4-dihydroxy-2-butanone-4-phosphate synthase [Halococcus]
MGEAAESNESSESADPAERTIAAFARGDPVLVHDAADREGETDLIYPAGAVTPDAVARLRNDAGGLVCVALSDGVASAFDLPFTREIVDHPAADGDALAYGDRSSFSLTANHRDTYTGITDDDRALTITALGRAAAAPDDTDFAATFRVPGHVHLLRGAPDLLAGRRGHTELALALAAAADRAPAAVVCEMLDDAGGALAPTDAQTYAEEHDLVYVEGSALVDRLG